LAAPAAVASLSAAAPGARAVLDAASRKALVACLGGKPCHILLAMS
jgi:hypothetical protein